jgi:hypothetical protein
MVAEFLENVLIVRVVLSPAADDIRHTALARVDSECFADGFLAT